jgi:aerobic carbon-monoxide dehydrogenase medium subunit
VKPVAFDYLQARDLHQAAEALARSAGAKIIAGAQSLGPLLNLRLARPELLVDISRVRELQRIEETDSRWRIGAGVTHAQLEDLGARLVGAEMVSEVAAQIAYRSVRNRGTIGGSLAHADPAADWPLALAALGAVLVLKGRGGSEQRVAADSFMLAAFITVLKQDEIVTAIEIPKRGREIRYGYFKFCRKTGDFPESSAAVVVDPGRSGRIFIGALSGAPQALTELAEAVSSDGMRAATEEATMAAVAAAAPEMEVIEVRMHAATVRHAVKQAFRQ